MIGSNETAAEALQRLGAGPPAYRRNCPDPTSNTPWAELRSSLLVKAVTEDAAAHQEMVDFMRVLVDNMASSIGYTTDQLFTYWIQIIPFQAYPVSRVLNFRNRPAAGFQDFFVLYEYMTWLRVKLQHPNNPLYNASVCSLHTGCIRAATIYSVLQQRTYFLLAALRGPRVKRQDRGLPDGQVINERGINSFSRAELVRDPRDNAWLHGGYASCISPFYGTYGENILDSRQENRGRGNGYGSMQCGISPSVQYLLYSYLVSCDAVTAPQNRQDVEDALKGIVLAATLVMVGDGGHNIREVVTGISLVVTFLYVVLDKIKTGVAAVPGMGGGMTFGGQLDRLRQICNGKDLRTILQTSPNLLRIAEFLQVTFATAVRVGDSIDVSCGARRVNQIYTLDQAVFFDLLENFVHWETFLTEARDFLRQYNILGTTSAQVAKTIREWNAPSEAQLRQGVNQRMFERLFDANVRARDYKSEAEVNELQMLVAVDLDRYAFDPEEFPSTLLAAAVRSTRGFDAVQATVDAQLARVRNQCRAPQMPEGVPFAFKGRKKSKTRRKVTRRSRKR